MPNALRAVMALAALAVVSACAPQNEPVYVVEPVQSQPATGKYK